MAIRSLIQLRGFLETLPLGGKNIAPSDIQNNTPPQEETQLVLASGANTITVPALAIGCIIIFDSTSAIVKTLKGVTGDTGILLRPTSWNVLSFTAAATASFVINASAEDTGLYTTILFF